MPYALFDDQGSQLRADFNRKIGSVRLLFVVDPVCPTCLRGLADMNRDLLQSTVDPRLHTFVVHEPVLGVARVAPWLRMAGARDVARAALLLHNPQVQHYWNPSGAFGRLLSQSVGLKNGERQVYAWDVWLIYGPEAQWEGADPPRPRLLMHQLGALRGSTAFPHLDSRALCAAGTESARAAVCAGCNAGPGPLCPMIVTSQLTCPNCGHVAHEIMPTDACIYFYDCAGCGEVLKPKSGDCAYLFLRVCPVSPGTSRSIVLPNKGTPMNGEASCTGRAGAIGFAGFARGLIWGIPIGILVISPSLRYALSCHPLAGPCSRSWAWRAYSMPVAVVLWSYPLLFDRTVLHAACWRRASLRESACCPLGADGWYKLCDCFRDRRSRALLRALNGSSAGTDLRQSVECRRTPW